MILTKTNIRATASALALGLLIAGCTGMPTNRSLDSLNQPVVERTNFTFDLASGAGGLPGSERMRLENWFDSMNLAYGDRVYVDDPVGNAMTREAIAEIAGRRGILLSEGAPVTVGYVDPGTTRVIITRSSAYVPGCPDWTTISTMNYNNGGSSNFGCATNSNLAAMVADPEDLVNGDAATGDTTFVSNRAIASYRDQPPTGEAGLIDQDTGGGD